MIDSEKQAVDDMMELLKGDLFKGPHFEVPQIIPLDVYEAYAKGVDDHFKSEK